MLRIDTHQLASVDRFEVVHDALRTASNASTVEVLKDGLAARISVTPLGSTAVFSTDSTSMLLARDARVSRDAPDDVIAIGVQTRGTGRHDVYGQQRLVGYGELIVTDITRPYEWSWEGRAAACSLQVPRAVTGLSVDQVRQAALNLRSTPLTRLFGRHLASVAADAEALAAHPYAATVADVSLDLARAVLVEAATAASGERAATDATLPAQVEAYVRQHVRDPDLGPASIAAGLAVSRRHLYRVCSRAGISIEQCIISRRLAMARSELASPDRDGRSVADIALAVGFRDVDHFRRRFRQAFGLPPRDFREQVRAERLT